MKTQTNEENNGYHSDNSGCHLLDPAERNLLVAHTKYSVGQMKNQSILTTYY
jgi:hypothetical protein